MTLSRQQRCAGGLVLAVALLLAWLSQREPREPKLTAIYLGRSHPPGRWIYEFGITNVGTGAAVPFDYGETEVAGQKNPDWIAGMEMPDRLAPGSGFVFRILKKEPIKGRWRYTFRFMRESVRTRIVAWLYRNHEVARWANPVVPDSLLELVNDVTATSEWIDE